MQSAQAKGRRPLIIIYTGNGKGKTTAAMGIVMRTLGHEKSCAVIQFIKPERLKTGEKSFAQQQGVLWENYGEGFLWDVTDDTSSRQLCAAGWQRAQELISSRCYELIVLDEFTYPLTKQFLDVEQVIQFLDEARRDPGSSHIVITGRDAPADLVDVADMVHELVEIKHPWRTKKIGAQRCIEY